MGPTVYIQVYISRKEYVGLLYQNDRAVQDQTSRLRTHGVLQRPRRIIHEAKTLKHVNLTAIFMPVLPKLCAWKEVRLVKVHVRLATVRIWLFTHTVKKGVGCIMTPLVP